jgi:hypothetical protein
VSAKPERDPMQLPPGAQCDQCFAYRHCNGLFGCEPTSTRCDWSPSRFSYAQTYVQSLRDQLAERGTP